jgi:uncharacterized protein (DUF433 family)
MTGLKQYQYLESRPHRRKKQLWLKGRNMTVWNLVSWMQSNSLTPDEAAKDFGLPVEAVHEALDYYHKNRLLIDAELSEERELLRTAGLLKD